MENLLLLHGATGTKAQFDALTPLLNDHFHIHALDFEGHGSRATSDGPFTITHFAEDVVRFMDGQDIAQTHLFGFSMGGYVALYLAQTQPARVGKVFTLATKFHWTTDVAHREAGLLDADKILAKVPHYAESLQEQHGDHWRVVLEKTKALLISLGEHNLMTTYALKQITTRARVSIGDRDTMVSIEESLTAYRALPKGEFQVFPNTPHPFDQVAPGILAQAIHQFLA